jgi:hypothetical protein
MCSRVWGLCCKWSPNSIANLIRFSRHTIVRDWKTWILYGCMRKSVRSMLHAVEGDTSFSEANCCTDFRAGDEATLAWMVPAVSGVRTRGLLPPLFLPAIFPVARNCSTVFTVFFAGASLHSYWFLNWRWTVTFEFVCRNHSTIRVFCSVVSCGAILNDVTGASVAKYGKNTNVWRLRRYHLHRAVYFILYRLTKIDSNWQKHPVYLTRCNVTQFILSGKCSDDGWRFHPKQIEQFPDKINCKVASCWIYIRILLRCMDPWTLKTGESIWILEV